MEETPTDRPYIDKVHAQLGVAIGGNGYAAKSSDEIGRLAACMMTEGWNSEIPQDVFKLRLRHSGLSSSKAKLWLYDYIIPGSVIVQLTVKQ